MYSTSKEIHTVSSLYFAVFCLGLVFVDFMDFLQRFGGNGGILPLPQFKQSNPEECIMVYTANLCVNSLMDTPYSQPHVQEIYHASRSGNIITLLQVCCVLACRFCFTMVKRHLQIQIDYTKLAVFQFDFIFYRWCNYHNSLISKLNKYSNKYFLVISYHE